MLLQSRPEAEKMLEGESPIPRATGPRGSIPHPAYCTPQCYAKGKPARRGSCLCRGCRGDAHGRGKKYAFDRGYLKYSLLGSRKSPVDQELLFPEEPPDSVDDAERLRS